MPPARAATPPDRETTPPARAAAPPARETTPPASAATLPAREVTPLVQQKTLRELMRKTRNWSGEVPNILPKTFDKKLQTTKEYNITEFTAGLFFGHVSTAHIFYHKNTNAENTNKYAEHMLSLHWKHTDAIEIRAYLGMIILMGGASSLHCSLHWSTDPLFYNPVIAKVMPCKRFKQITENLHLNDKAAEVRRGHPDYDILCKVREVMNILNETFLENCTASSSHSIDESMVKFKGTMKQYMTKKPIKGTRYGLDAMLKLDICINLIFIVENLVYH